MLNSVKGELKIGKSTVRSEVAGMQSELQLNGCWEPGREVERAALGRERAPGSEPEGPTLTFSSAASVHQCVNSYRRTPGPWLALALTKLQV